MKKYRISVTIDNGAIILDIDDLSSETEVFAATMEQVHDINLANEVVEMVNHGLYWTL